MESLINLKKAAEMLSMSTCSIYRKVEQGALPHVRLGRTIRFRPSALEKFVADHAVESAFDKRQSGA
jgi:excisionase family DNA binding protein